MDLNQNIQNGNWTIKKFLEEKNFKFLIENFPENMTLNQLQNCTDEDLLEKFKISSITARSELLKTIRNIKLCDQESGGSGNECYVVKHQPQHHFRASSFVARRPIDLLLLRRLSRVGSEKSRSGCIKPQTGASLDNSQNLLKTKTLHLGRSAPNISYHSPETSNHKKLFPLKSDRPSLPSCQTPTSSINKTYKHASIRDSSKVSLVLQQLHLKTRRMSVNSIFSSDWSSYPSPSSAFSSVHSSQEHLYQRTSDSIDDSSVWGDGPVEQGESSCASPQTYRRRTQSFNYKVSETDSHLTALNDFYRSCFPKAIAEMEQKLIQFLEQRKLTSFHQTIKCDGSASFVLHQLLELATDCLEKSRANQISASYFSELMRGMQQLLENARLQSSFPCDELAQMIQNILIIISRPARLLECLEFDPKTFYRQLEEDEGRRINSADVISYIYEKLGLHKKGVEDVKIQNESPETSSNNSSFEFNRSPDPSMIAEDFKSHSSGLPLFRPPQESDFETVKLISNGAYGAVQLVRHRESRKLFAMKKLLKSDLVLRNMVEQVFAERDILTFIDNPFVVSFYCSFETKKHLCLVLEYVEGGDCGALLKNIAGPLPLDMARLYFAETVLALEYLHNFGIVHRDLKPDNLLLTSAGHIKLTDFGLSKIGLMKMTTNLYEGVNKDCNQFLDYQVFGTPEYIAPEVILRQGYGRPVDWWSLGVILYQFLVGCVPFFGDTAEEVFNEIISGEILWPEEEEFRVCDEARDIIESLLERNPLQRLGYSGAAEVKGHIFFKDVDWDGLLRQKSQFVPTLADEEDTSYFDVRLDRYNHNSNNNLEDSDEDESESELFRSFSTCSPRYSKTEQMIFVDKIRQSPADASLTEINSPSPILDNDLCNSMDSTKFTSLNNSTDVSPKPFPNRADNKSCSSLHEVVTSLETEKEQSHRRNKSLKLTGSLKRQRESKVSKSSSSASLSNSSFNASRSKIPHRLVRQFSKESSGSSFDDSYTDSSPKTVKVTKGRNGFGFNFRALKVLNEVTNRCSFQHVIVDIDKNSPAHEAGLCVGDMLTHINGVRVFGLQHCQVVKLILDRQSSTKLTKSSRHKKLMEASKSQMKMSKNDTELSAEKEDSQVVVEESKKHKAGGGENKMVTAEIENSEVNSAAASNGKLRCSGRGKFLKLFMMNALKRNKRNEDRKSMWYTGNEGIAGEASDENQEAGGGCDGNSLSEITSTLCETVICTSEYHHDLNEEDNPVDHTVEFKVLPTIKLKKSMKLGRKVLCKKKSLDVLLLPKSVLNKNGYSKKNKHVFEGSGAPMSPIFGKSAECALTGSDSTQSPTGGCRQHVFRSISGRPSSLSWAGRRMSNAMLSPLVLCSSSPFKQSEKVTKTLRSPSLLESDGLTKSTAEGVESEIDHLPAIEVFSPSCQ